MGLDILDVIYGMEKEFAVKFTLDDPIGSRTPRHYISRLTELLPMGYADGCLTSRTFYRIADALQRINLAWFALSPRTRMDGLVDKKTWKHLWPNIRCYAGGESWPRKVPWPEGWFTSGLDKTATLGELARFVAMESAEARPKPGQGWSWEQVALRFRWVIWDRMGGLLRFSLNDDFNKDMGLE